LQSRTPQIEIAVLEALILAGRDLIFDLERRCLGLVEDRCFERDDLDRSGRESGISKARPIVLGAPVPNLPAHPEHPLRSGTVGGVEGFLVGGLRIEDHLGQPITVTQVNEDTAPVVASVLHPTEENDLLIDVLLSQFTTGMRTLELVDKAGHHRPPSARFFGRCGKVAASPVASSTPRFLHMYRQLRFGSPP
jgi:hypothetical protein